MSDQYQGRFVLAICRDMSRASLCSVSVLALMIGAAGCGAAYADAAGDIAKPTAASAPVDTGSLEEVVVTARKRSERLQDIPTPVSVVTGQNLKEIDAQSVIDLTGRIPNFLAPLNTVSADAPQFFLRGIGRAENNWNYENAVAVFVDDVYLQSTAGAYVDTMDFDRVEVLRGPQGTLYGRNAAAGAIKFIFPDPNLSELKTKGEVTFGSHARIDLKGSVTAPIVADVLGFKLDAYDTRNDGYLTRVNAQNQSIDDSVDRRHHTGVRLAFLARPIDDLKLEFAADYERERDGTNLSTPIQAVSGDPFSTDGSATFEPVYGPNRVGGEPRLSGKGTKYDGYGAVFKATWDLGWASLKSITAYRGYSEKYDSQLSGDTQPLAIPIGPDELIHLSTYIDSRNYYKQFTQEFQMTGKILDKLDYTSGLYYFWNDWKQKQFVGPLIPVEFNPPNGGAVNNTAQIAQSVAGYADATYHLTDDFSLSVGARYTFDHKNVRYLTTFENGAAFPGFPVYPKKSFYQFTPRAGLDYKVDKDLLVYFSYSKGYVAGFLKGARTVDPASASDWLAPLKVENFEGGVKADWFDGKLRTNLTVFDAQYSNLAFLYFSGTAVEAAQADIDVKGVEAEISGRPTPQLRLYANLGFLDANYVSAKNSPIFNPGGSFGQQPALGLNASPVVTPEYTISAGATYTWALADGSSLDFGADVTAVAKQYGGLGVTNYDAELVAPYHIFSTSATWQSSDDSLAATVGIENLTDETYYTTSNFGQIPGRTYADGRSFYVRLTYRGD